jgi:tetratricopeptide (TPR) repeat protein
VADSLEREISLHPAADTIRINLLQSLCKATHNTQRGIAAANEIISIAQNLGLTSKQGNGYMFRASAYLEEGADSLYLADLERAGLLYKKVNDKKGEAVVYRAYGRYYEARSAYNKALENYNKAIEIFGQISEKRMLMFVYSDVGNCYNKIGNYNKAVEYYLKAQKDAEQQNDLQTQAIVINNIALVNRLIKKYNSAIEQYRESLKIYAAINDSSGYARALQGIGITYDLQNHSDSSLYYYNKALGINLRNNFKLNAAENYNNIGVIYKDKNAYSHAYGFITKAIQLFTELNRHSNVKQAEINIGEMLCTAPDSFFTANHIPLTNRFEKALQIFNSTLAYGKETEDLRLQTKSWEGLSITYEKAGDYKKALAALKQNQKLQDSLVNEELVEATTKQAEQFEFEKKEAITQSLFDAEIKQQKTVRNALLAGAGLLILGSIISFLFYKRKRDAVASQQEAEFKTKVADTEMKALRAQMNPHFIFNSLNSISDYIAKNNVAEADRYLSKFAKLMRMILENSEQKDVPLADDLKALELYMQLEALRLNNKFTYEIKVDGAIDTAAALIPPLILQPFVENSIWHGIAEKESEGKITIHIQQENDQMICCVVEDNGIGRKQSAIVKTAAPRHDKTSLGMKITQARIDILNKQKNSKAAVVLSDLEPGVRVEVRLPLITAY